MPGLHLGLSGADAVQCSRGKERIKGKVNDGRKVSSEAVPENAPGTEEREGSVARDG